MNGSDWFISQRFKLTGNVFQEYLGFLICRLVRAHPADLRPNPRRPRQTPLHREVLGSANSRLQTVLGRYDGSSVRFSTQMRHARRAGF